MIKLLINNSFKKYLLNQPSEYRKKVRRKFEYLEIGYWEGGLNVKKLKSLAGQKAVFEARLDRANRILFTLGNEEENGTSNLLIYVWGIVAHDSVSHKSTNILPANVPFLQFKPYQKEVMDETLLEDLSDTYFTQESITQKISDDSASQRWHFLDEENWQRIQNYRQDEFEMQLYLTPEQQEVLSRPLPLLVSGTAGSGKTTLGIYYLLKLPLAKEKKLFITYNRYLRDAALKLYQGLLNASSLKDEYSFPDFFTFREYCLEVAEKYHNKFSREKEVHFENFNEMVVSNSQAKRYDTPLIWEEIRSIIKGALPQININILKNAPERLKSKPIPPAFLSALQQQFLTFAQLKSLEKVEKFVQKYLQTDLLTFSRNLKYYIENQGDRVITVFDRTLNLLLKERELTQKKYLSFIDYEALGKKKAPNFRLDRRSLYRVFEWYQDKLDREGLWDELDLAREVMNVLSERDLDEHRYDLAVCDEVQDLTDVQHELLFYVVRNPMNLLLSGDTKQIVNPSGFRWEELKRHFYERELKIPELHFLNLNFRSSGSIVQLSNTLLDLKAGLLGSSAEELKEDWKYKGRPPVVVQNLTQKSMLENIHSTGAKKTILVRTEEEKNQLRKTLETELIFTINEAKGLEFNTVLLWRFGSDIRTKDVWKVILTESNRDIHQAKIKHEINLLYVAITRAQKDLLIYDGQQSSLIWRSEPIRDKVYATDDLNYIGSIWNVISTPEEWLEQGHYFFEREYYKAAMECYKNAGEDNLVLKSKACDAERRQDFKVAASSFERIGELEKAAFYHEKNENYDQAHRLWQKLKKKQNAFRCHLKILEQKGSFGALADIYLSRKAYREAFEFLVKAKKYDEAAEVSLKRLSDKQQAALYYEKAGLYKQSAALYQQLKDFEQSAALYEKAKDFDGAKKLWKRLKREDRLIAIYHQTEDYANLLKIYEKARDFNNAVKILKKLPDSAALLSQAQDFYENRKYFPALIRFFVMNDHLRTAKSHIKLKNFTEAARSYELAGDYYNAAKACQKSKDFKAAMLNYLKSEEDKQNGFIGARRMARSLFSGEINDIGQQFLHRKQYESAEFCFSLTYNNDRAGICAMESGRQEKALKYWEKCLGNNKLLEVIAGYCLKQNHVKIGAEFILSHSPYAYNSFYYDYKYQIKTESPLIIMMDKYFVLHPNEEEMLKWIQILEGFGHSEYIEEKKLLYLERSRQYNYYFSYLIDLSYCEPNYLAQMKRKFKREYKKLVKDTSELSAIKLYFLGKYEDFNRVLGQLEMTENNYRIFAESDYYEKAVDLLAQNHELHELKRILVKRDEFLRLAEIFEKYQFVEDAANYYSVAGKHEKSATMFEQVGKFSRAGEAYYKASNYEKALEMYMKTGKNKAKIAQIYEKVGDYAKAADIWKELGKPRKYQNCVAKLNTAELF